MKRILLTLLLLLFAAPSLAQTITAVSIETGGWTADVTISGFTDLGTLNFGSGFAAGQNNNPTGATVVFSVTRPTDYGGSTGTVVDTVYGTKGVRYPWPAAWAAATAYAVNTVIQDSTANCNSGGNACEQKVIACSGSCTSGGSITFTNSALGSTKIDNAGANQVTWENIGTIPATGSSPVRVVSPNESLATGGSVIIRISLSDFVYSADTVTVSIASGFYVDNGPNGGGMSSSALSGGTSVTNNSTLAYSTSKPLCRATWPGYERVTANFPVEVLCGSRFARNQSEVESVVFTATDQHSNSLSYTVTAMTKSFYNRAWTNAAVPYASGPGDAGGVALVYAATVNVSTLTQGDQVTVTWKAYPWAGDSTAVFNSAVGQDGSAQPSEYVGPLYEILDKTGAYGSSFIHVKSGGASSCGSHVYNTRAGAEGDSTGVNSIALGASCLEAYNNTNYSRADAGGGMIAADTGNWDLSASQYALGTMKTWMVLDKVSTLKQSQVVITANSNNIMDSDSNTLLKVQNISVTGSFTLAYGNNSTSDIDSVWFHNVNLGGYTNNGGLTRMSGAFYATQTYNSPNFCGCFNYGGGGGRAPWALIRGNFAISPSLATNNWGAEYALISNYGLEPYEIDSGNNASQGSSDNSIAAFNYVYDVTDSDAGVGQTTSLTKGSAWIQNVYESGASIGGTLSGQAANVTVNNIIVQHNSQGTGGGTFAAGRSHVCYDTVNTYSNPMNNWSEAWNNWNSYSSETDNSTDTNAASGLRIGAWPCLFGVAFVGNVHWGCASCFDPEFQGLGFPVTSSSVQQANPEYLNGGPSTNWYGSYNILNTSADIAIAPWTTTANEVLPYDMLGAPRTCPSGLGCTAGAYMYGIGYATVASGKVRKGQVGQTLPTASTPTFSPTAGAIASGTTIAISTSSSGCSGYIYWNFTGTSMSSGTNSSTSSGITGASTLYAQVLGCPGYAASAIGSAAYTIAPAANQPTFSPAAGSYGSSQSVTISTTSSGAVICYNTTGSPHTNGSTGCAGGSSLYSTAVSVSSSETLYAVAGGTSYADSTVGSAAYTITVYYTPAYVQASATVHAGSASSISGVTTSSGDDTAGNSVFIYSYCSTSSRTLSITASTNTYTQIATGTVAAGEWYLWEATGVAGGAESVTIGASGGTCGDFYGMAAEFTHTTLTVDVGGSSTSTTGYTSGSVTTNYATDLLLGILTGGDGGTVGTHGSGWSTLEFSNAGGRCPGWEYQIPGSTGSYDAVFASATGTVQSTIIAIVPHTNP